MAKDGLHNTITVSGITFSAEEVKSAVVVKGGREVTIGEKQEEKEKTGFN